MKKSVFVSPPAMSARHPPSLPNVSAMRRVACSNATGASRKRAPNPVSGDSLTAASCGSGGPLQQQQSSEVVEGLVEKAAPAPRHVGDLQARPNVCRHHVVTVG